MPRLQPFRRAAAALIVMLSAATLAPDHAHAGIEFVVVQLTPVALSDGTSPAAQILVSNTGDVTLITSGAGGTHILPVTLGQGQDADITYTFNELPLAPTSWTLGPEGDLLLRGNVQPTLDTLLGVTARVDLGDGSVVWEQPDEAFSESPDYIGRYNQGTGPIAWSPDAQRVLVFSQSDFDIAPVSQGSMLFEFNGDVRVPSITFGDQYIGAVLARALTTPDGEFLVYYFAQNEVGARFYLYDGRDSVSFWTPEGGDWTQRVVYLIDYAPDGNLFLVWSELGDDAPVRMSKIDPEGKLLFDVDLSGNIPVADPQTGEKIGADLERPQFMVTADEEIVLLRAAGPSFVFDVRDASNGDPLGFKDFGELTDKPVYDLEYLQQSDRNYLLTTTDPENDNALEILQVQLSFNSDPVVIGGADNNGSGNSGQPGGTNNNDPINPGGGGDGSGSNDPDVDTGCGCAVPAAPSPDLPAPLALVALAAVLIVSRRRSAKP